MVKQPTKKRLINIEWAKESIIGTITVFILFFILKLFPFKFEFVKPIKQELNDFDVYDLVYSGVDQKNLKRDSSIVLVQVSGNRGEIANDISAILRYSPKVVGIDLLFPDSSLDRVSDSLLAAVLNDPRVVTGQRLDIDSQQNTLVAKQNFFEKTDQKNHSGYFNFLGDQNSVVRRYYPFMEVERRRALSFTSAIIQQFDKQLYDKFHRQAQMPQIINYTGNVNNYTVFRHEDLEMVDPIQLSSLFQNKVILLGVIYPDEPRVMEDLHFTPINEKLQGKSYPDMYGLVIHANILSMIMSGRYPYQLSNYWSLLIAFLICCVVMYHQIKIYGRNRHPNHLILILFQFFFIIVFIYLALLVFQYAQIKIQLFAILLCVVLSVELFSIYKMFALWLNKTFKYKTVFKK